MTNYVYPTLQEFKSNTTCYLKPEVWSTTFFENLYTKGTVQFLNNYYIILETLIIFYPTCSFQFKQNLFV